MAKFQSRRSPAYHASIEALECRFLLTATNQAAAQIARVRHEYHDYVSFVQILEQHSKATNVEALALRDDALAISQAASTTTLNRSVANQKATDASIQIDRAFLDGFLDDQGWAVIKSRMDANLEGLNVSDSVVVQTIADMKTVAHAAGVSAGAYSSFATKYATLQNGEAYISNSYVHFDSPELFYTQHLRGFIQGGTAEKRQEKAKLNADIHTIAFPAHDAAALAVINRDVKLLEQVGSRVSIAGKATLQKAYLVAFANGPPKEAALSQLSASLSEATQGNAQPNSTNAAIDRLITDAPMFSEATGSSTASIETILIDVAAYLDAGGSQPLNPYRVQVVR